VWGESGLLAVDSGPRYQGFSQRNTQGRSISATMAFDLLPCLVNRLRDESSLAAIPANYQG